MTTTMKTSKIHATWIDRIDSGVLTLSLCRQFAASITRQVMGYEPRGFKTAITVDEAENLYAYIQAKGGVRLTQDHEQTGFDWLRRTGVKAMDMHVEPGFDVVERFSHFTFHGDAYLAGRQSLPIWRIHFTGTGTCIDYFWGAWQEAAYSRDSRPFRWWLTNLPNVGTGL